MKYATALEVATFLDKKSKRGSTEGYVITPSDPANRKAFFERYRREYGVESYKPSDEREAVSIYEVSSNRDDIIINKGNPNSIRYKFDDISGLPIILEIGKQFSLDTSDILDIVEYYLKQANPYLPEIISYTLKHKIRSPQFTVDITNQVPANNNDYPPYFLILENQIAEICSEVFKGDVNSQRTEAIHDKLKNLDFSKPIFISIDQRLPNA